MKPDVKQEDFSDLSDRITDINECISTVKKLLLVLKRQKDTLKEDAVQYMIKEIRYELLTLIQRMDTEGKPKQKCSDDLEREVFTVGFETMLEELRILGIREEWMLQQKNLAELQDHICQVNRQISMHSTYRSTQGAVLGKLFNKIIAENGTMEQLIGEEEFVELLQIAMESVNSYFASNLCGCPDKEEEYKYTLALCEIIGCIADNDAGRQLLLKSGWELMEKFASVIFRIRCPPGEKFKQAILKAVVNMSKDENACEKFRSLKNIILVFDECLNHPYGNKITLFCLELLYNTIQRANSGFFKLLENCITPIKFEPLLESSDKNIKKLAKKIVHKLEKVISSFAERKEADLAKKNSREMGKCICGDHEATKTTMKNITSDKPTKAAVCGKENAPKPPPNKEERICRKDHEKTSKKPSCICTPPPSRSALDIRSDVLEATYTSPDRPQSCIKFSVASLPSSSSGELINVDEENDMTADSESADDDEEANCTCKEVVAADKFEGKGATAAGLVMIRSEAKGTEHQANVRQRVRATFTVPEFKKKFGGVPMKRC